MTEAELKLTFCPHSRDQNGEWELCIGSACSQYREKTNDTTNTTRRLVGSPIPPLDPEVWRLQFTRDDTEYYMRILPRLNAWCGLAGTPHYAKV